MRGMRLPRREPYQAVGSEELKGTAEAEHRLRTGRVRLNGRIAAPLGNVHARSIPARGVCTVLPVASLTEQGELGASPMGGGSRLGRADGQGRPCARTPCRLPLPARCLYAFSSPSM